MGKKSDNGRIGQRELAHAVDQATSLAARKHKLKLEPNLFQRDVFHLPWWIVGRVLREQVDLDHAFKAAETITQGVKLDGVDLQPVALKIQGDILVGFIERFGDRLEIQDTLLGGAEL